MNVCSLSQVMDLAEGHACALQYIEKADQSNNTYSVFNLGSGKGYSVLEMVQAMRSASGSEIKTEIAARRVGDIAVCYADTAKATRELGWTAKRDLDAMCRGKYRIGTHLPNQWEFSMGLPSLGPLRLQSSPTDCA